MRRLVAACLLILGVVAFGYGFHAKGQVAEARKGFSTMMSPFTDEAPGKIIEGVGEHKLQEYDGQVMLCFGVGALLVIVGGILLFIPRGRGL